MDFRVNAHIHTPYSFSGFESVAQAAEMASREGVGVLGINDFNTVKGYTEFEQACQFHRIFPLYNIEFIALSEEDRDQGRRWNDPQNPGVMYFCGKGLNHPSTLSEDSKNRLSAVWKGSQERIWKITARLNDCLEQAGIPVKLDYNTIRSTFARNAVRERHVARALCEALHQQYPQPDELRANLQALYGGTEVAIDVTDSVALQNDLRSQLLKAGKPAFVQTSPSAFLSMTEVKRIILDGGGIPCYPVLADDSRELNEHERDVAALAETLMKRGVHAVEFIPKRNSLELLKRYAGHFHRRDFCVTFGTEHNTPGLPTLVPQARGETPFDEELERIGYEGACIVAAHQEKHRRGEGGYVDRRGRLLGGSQSRAELTSLGDSLIRDYVQRT